MVNGVGHTSLNPIVFFSCVILTECGFALFSRRSTTFLLLPSARPFFFFFLDFHVHIAAVVSISLY